MSKRKKTKHRPVPKNKARKPFLSLRKWWCDGLGKRRSFVKFWLGFLGIMLLFYILNIQPFYIKNIQEPIGVFFAHLSSGLLGLMGQGTVAEGLNIASDKFSLLIQNGCDAIAPTVLVITGILLYPAERRKKLIGIMTGLLFLFVLNLFRIVSLFFAGVYAPGYFEFLHIEFWQVVFIGLSILYFFYWLNWVTKADSHAQVP